MTMTALMFSLRGLGRTVVMSLFAVLLVSACASRRDAAPVIDRSPQPASASRSASPVASVAKPAPEGFYVVKRGDTLYSIALDHGADYREVAQWNALEDPTRIYVGQQLRVTEPPPRKGVQVGAVRSPSHIAARPLGAQEASAKASSAKAPAPTQPAAVPKALATAPDDFIWPAKGKVIAGFAEPRSKGIDIDGRPGDPVVAAAGGRVTYTGSGIPGLGKLVVLRHDNGFITVYAHNREILVKEQQTVARGQKIAELGSTDADRPKLHFQIRRGSAPVDPMRYLPGS